MPTGSTTADSGSYTVIPALTFVAPTLVNQGQEFGHAGEKMVPLVLRVPPRQPFLLESPPGPATPSSPEAKNIEVPCRPSLRNSLHWR